MHFKFQWMKCCLFLLLNVSLSNTSLNSWTASDNYCFMQHVSNSSKSKQTVCRFIRMKFIIHHAALITIIYRIKYRRYKLCMIEFGSQMTRQYCFSTKTAWYRCINNIPVNKKKIQWIYIPRWSGSCLFIAYFKFHKILYWSLSNCYD